MRLGVDFFRQLPKCPGVYLMRDAGENILYVGKAKNLRQRLYSYRIANPDRLGRRHLRLLRQVVRIEWRLCPDEAAALAQEAELLRSIRPKFNRAGVWPVKPKVVLWRNAENSLRLKIGETAETGWQSIGPLKGARWLRHSLAGLLWLATHETGIGGLPAGWAQGKMEDEAVIQFRNDISEVGRLLQLLNDAGVQPLIEWLRQSLEAKSRLATSFETAWFEAELEALESFRLDQIGQCLPTKQVKDEQRLFAFA